MCHQSNRAQISLAFGEMWDTPDLYRQSSAQNLHFPHPLAGQKDPLLRIRQRNRFQPGKFSGQVANGRGSPRGE